MAIGAGRDHPAAPAISEQRQHAAGADRAAPEQPREGTAADRRAPPARGGASGSATSRFSKTRSQMRECSQHRHDERSQRARVTPRIAQPGQQRASSSAAGPSTIACAMRSIADVRSLPQIARRAPARTGIRCSRWSSIAARIAGQRQQPSAPLSTPASRRAIHDGADRAVRGEEVRAPHHPRSPVRARSGCSRSAPAARDRRSSTIDVIARNTQRDRRADDRRSAADVSPSERQQQR